AAAYVASMRNVFRNQAQRRSVFSNDPFNAQGPNLLFKCSDRQFEFSLFESYRDEIVRKRSTPFVSDQRVEEGQTVLAPRNTYGNSIAWTQHGKPAHGAPHRIQYFLFDIRHRSQSYLNGGMRREATNSRWCVNDPLPPSAALPLVRGALTHHLESLQPPQFASSN